MRRLIRSYTNRVWHVRNATEVLSSLIITSHCNCIIQCDHTTYFTSFLATTVAEIMQESLDADVQTNVFHSAAELKQSQSMLGVRGLNSVQVCQCICHQMNTLVQKHEQMPRIHY